MKTAIESQFFFGEFEIDARRRVLLKNGQTIALNPKAFDLLQVLVERHGEIVSKNDLLDAVWRDRFVEEKNLTVHVAALRKVFGERKDENRYIVTVPGTGYKFVAPLNDSLNEIVIETEKFERITIEEEEEKTRKRKSELRSLSLSKILLFSFSLLLIFALLTGYLWLNSNLKNYTAISVERLTTNGKVQIAALSPDGKLFAYVTKEFEKSSLRLGYTGGGNDIQLRPLDETVYHQLAFSPNGNQLYLSMHDERNPNDALYRMPTFGGAPEKMADKVSDFRLSPDGNVIAYGRNNSNEHKNSLIVSSINGADEREVFSVPTSKSFEFQSISWSPNGQRLAFGCERDEVALRYDICLEEISSGKIERITLAAWRFFNATAWLKDGTGLIVAAIPENSFSSVTRFQILYVELPSGKIREITNDLSTYDSLVNLSDDSKFVLSVEHRQLDNLWIAPSDNLSQAKQITFGSFGKYDGLWGLDWTPDGRIIYTSSDRDSQIISAMNSDGSDQKELTAAGFVDSALTVSNDGRWIVFHSSRGGGVDIWRMDVDGGNLKQITYGKKSFHPSISPDNRYVYYKCWEKDVGELRRIPIDGGDSEILTDKETGWSSFSPDGKYFSATYKTDQRRLAIFSAETNQIIKQFDVSKTAIFDMRPRWTPDSKSVVYRDSAYGYWSQKIEGGAPQKLEGLPKEILFTYAYSKDGKQFAFVRGQTNRDVILIGNIK